jgi:hypothetical protein
VAAKSLFQSFPLSSNLGIWVQVRFAQRLLSRQTWKAMLSVYFKFNDSLTVDVLSHPAIPPGTSWSWPLGSTLFGRMVEVRANQKLQDETDPLRKWVPSHWKFASRGLQGYCQENSFISCMVRTMTDC